MPLLSFSLLLVDFLSNFLGACVRLNYLSPVVTVIIEDHSGLYQALALALIVILFLGALDEEW